jgi:hypothetical protein
VVCIGVWARRVGCRSYISGGMQTLWSHRSFSINHNGLLRGLRGTLANGELFRHNGLPVAIMVSTTLADLEATPRIITCLFSTTAKPSGCIPQNGWCRRDNGCLVRPGTEFNEVLCRQVSKSWPMTHRCKDRGPGLPP